jgi:hypothetical protein
MIEMDMEKTKKKLKEVEAKVPKTTVKRQRRNPNRPKNKQRYYFTEDTQKAIVEWQQAESRREKDKIFTEKIYVPFLEIAKSLINVYNLADFEEREEVAADCASMLYEALNKFDATKGHRAFAYFSVVARHWLISRRKIQRKFRMRDVSYDSINPQGEEEMLSLTDIEKLQENQTIPSPDGVVTREDFSLSVEELWEEMLLDVESSSEMGENERFVIEACKVICDKAEELDIQTRNAMKLYLIEYTGLCKKELGQALKNLREVYFKNKEFVVGLEEFWES